MAVVRKTFFSQMIGCEKPVPGISAFQSTFFVSLHSVGRYLSAEMPCDSGPRHCGQLLDVDFAVVLSAIKADRASNKIEEIIIGRLIYFSPDKIVRDLLRSLLALR